MDTALDSLAAIAPSEYGGAHASSGLAYQRSWTVCMLVELHKDEGDYLVVCDYHDDVLVLSGGALADKIDFYQVKTTNKRPWTIARLVKREKGKSGELLPSVVGKLFRHKQVFKSSVSKMAVVCNLPFSVDVEEGEEPTDERFTFMALKDKDRQAIAENIKAELALPDSPDIGVSLVFIVSTLNLADHENGTRGRLEELLREKYPDRQQFPVHPIYRVLADEIARLSRYKNPCRNVADLVALKGFQRKQFEEYIVSCIREADRCNPQRLVDDVREELRADGLPFIRRQRVTEALEKYCLERMDRGRGDLAKLGLTAARYVSTGVSSESGFSDILATGLENLKKVKESRAFTDDYLMAVVAWEVLANGWKLPPAPAQSEEE